MPSIFITAAVILILQFTAVNYAKTLTPAFDIPLITLVFFSFRKGAKTGLILGITFGIFYSLFGLTHFWFYMFLYTGIGVIIGFVSRWFYKDNILSFIAMIFASEILFCFFYYTLSSHHLKTALGIPDYIFRISIPSIFCNTAFSVFLFYFLKGLRVYED